MMGLVLDPPSAHGLRAGPSLPTIIPPCPQRPIAFTTLAGLARRVQRLGAGRKIQLTESFAAYHGSDTFPIFKLWALGPAGQREYLAALAVQGVSRAAVEAAIVAADRGGLAHGRAA